MRKLISALAVFISIASCVPSSDSSDDKLSVNDASRFSDSYIRDLGNSDLPAALDLVDEGEDKGIFSSFDANLLRSKLIYQYSDNYPLSRQYSLAALSEADSLSDNAMALDAITQMVSVDLIRKDYASVIELCKRGRTLSREAGNYLGERSFDFSAGRATFNLGHSSDGIALMEDAVAGALPLLQTESDYGHWISILGNLANVYLSVDDFDDALDASVRQSGLLSRMEKAFPDAMSGYYSRTRFYNLINRANIYYNKGDKASADEAFSEALSLDYASTADGISRFSSYYALTGRVEELLDSYSKAPLAEPDSVNRHYYIRLTRISKAYANRGDSAMASEYAARAAALERMIVRRDSLEGSDRNVSGYRDLSYKTRLQDAENALEKTSGRRRLLRISTISLSTILLVLVMVTSLRRRKTKKRIASLLAENSSLRDEVESFRRALSEKVSDTETKGNVNPLSNLIEDQNLYLDKSLSRSMVMEILGCSQRQFSSMLSSIEPELTFPVYINRLRICHAISLMGTHPGMPLSKVAEESGFYSMRTFQRAFFTETGKSPSEYRNSPEN
ncbi:MAG: helix-turn-helix domain-containing protein [Bacteroidales bacterium]|nr:helix-turn-helix domain-containing protein [Bacteroidales bacterium]